MRAMVLDAPGTPLRSADLPGPELRPGQVRVRVRACGGFGRSAHIVAQLAGREGRSVYAFTRPGDEAAQSLALELGAVWAGAVGERPEELDAAIIFAPAGELVPEALGALAKGGTVVCAGIHMRDIPSFSYQLPLGGRAGGPGADLTSRDGEEPLS